MFQEPIVSFEEYDQSGVLVDQVGLRAFNPQRFEMEQLTAIVLNDGERRICVGYKDVTANEFWNRGHYPSQPIMPSVLLCEGAAQLCSYFVQTQYDFSGSVLLFAGLDDVEFRRPAHPGDRLVVMGKVLRYRPGVLMAWQFQHFVGRELICWGTLKGVPVPKLTEG
jgi:3-hydroxyacyl-[acyl-carrier-protein] dehydratase